MSWYNPYGAQSAYSSYGDPYARYGRQPARAAQGYSSWIDDEEDARARRALEEMYRRGPAPAPAQQQPQVRMEDEIAQKRAPSVPAAPVPPVQQAVTKPPRPAATEDELTGAADTIARYWRRRQALRQIDARAARFRKLRQEFVFPPVLDYDLGEGRVESVRAPPPAQILEDTESDVEEETEGEQEEREKEAAARLAFTPKNTPVHAYAEALLRVLNELDAVQSGGDARVRERRRAVVRAVEGEAARVERWWRVVWRRKGELGDPVGNGAPEVGKRGRRRRRRRSRGRR